jgi:putative transposase
MPTPEQFKAPFRFQCYYHILFRSIDGLVLFQTKDNYDFFLQKFVFFLNPVLDCFAYCLLKNHTHFIVQVKSKEEILASLFGIPEGAKTISMKRFISDAQNESYLDMLIERQINSFEVSYVNRINKVNSRKGGLFQAPFRCLEIMDEIHLQQAIIYTHANAQKHGIINNFSDYPHSSYQEILRKNSPVVNIKKVLQFFSDEKNLIKQHETQVQHFYSRNWPSSKLEKE